MKKNLIQYAVILALTILSLTGVGQNILFDHHKDAIVLDFNRPFFAGDDGFTFPTFAISLYGRYAVSDKVNIVGDIPFAVARFEDNSPVNSFSENDSQLGNIYLGVEIEGKSEEYYAEIGFRLPTSSDDSFASAIGIFGNYDRIESYIEDFVNFSTRFNYFFNSDAKVKIRLRAGPNLLIYTGDIDTVESEILLDYAGQAIYETDRFNFKAGLVGQLLVTENDIDFSDRVVHSFGLGLDFNLGRTHPGINLRVPLDSDIGDIISTVVGLNLKFGID